MRLGFLFLVLSSLISSFLTPTLSFDPSTGLGLDHWCNETPYPDTCKYFMQSSSEKNPTSFLAKVLKKNDFRKLLLKIALDKAISAQSHNQWLGSKCRNEKEKTAWSDCIQLYNEAIAQLNHTVDPNTSCTDFDIQTWLSTALTNFETCRTGFLELGVSDYVLPLMSSNNVSRLISNTLALNNGTSGPPETYYSYKEGFPSWVKPGDRKLLQTDSIRPNVVVAQDGSGDYQTIAAALDAVPKRSGDTRFVIYVKRGVYNENLEIGGSRLRNLMMVGDGLRYTIITGSRSVKGGSTTFRSPTVAVTSDGFIARGITFRNTAGPENHQAVALRSGADFSVFYRCRFEGYQDTLYVHSQRQFYKECYVYGTIDFIFGNAAVVLQNCLIYARRPMDRQKNVLTAQGRSDPNQNTGISIHDSVILAAPDLEPVLSSFQTFLGRPWREYSRTVFMRCYFGNLIDPAGWLEWDGDFALDTLYYGEYRNFGPGSSTSRRVSWRGFRVITSESEASRFTVANLIAGNSWLPATGVPFKAGM